MADAENEQRSIIHDLTTQDISNQKCVDCNCDLDFTGGMHDQPWCSINLGVFMCQDCCGSHRHMGAHISKMRSVCYDTGFADDTIVEVFRETGNARSNAKYEKYLPSYQVTPRECDSSRIRQYYIPLKYEKKAFMEMGAESSEMPQPVFFEEFTVRHPSIKKDAGTKIFYQLCGRTLNAFKKPNDPKPFKNLSLDNITGLQIVIEDDHDNFIITIGDFKLYHNDIQVVVEWVHALRRSSIYYSQNPSSNDVNIGQTVDISKAKSLGEAEKQPGSKGFFGTRWDKREWFIGSDNILYYVKPLGGADFGDIPTQGGIALSDACVYIPEGRVKKANPILICTPDRNFLLAISSEEAQKRWLTELGTIIQAVNEPSHFSFLEGRDIV